MKNFSNVKSYEADDSGAIKVPDSSRFLSTIERDTYYNTNPSKLTKGAYCTVDGQLQEFDGDSWEGMAVAIEGAKGDNAPTPLFQYSASGDSGWSNTINTSIHKYWRWSIDGGVSWSPNYIKFSGEGTGGGVPEPYSLSVGDNGKLQLYKSGILLQEQDETGSWISSSVSTGVGSLHLGDLHSMGSAGENVVFKNEDSTLAWHPCWGALSADGQTVIDQSARVHGATLEVASTVGDLGTVSVEYDSLLHVSGNVAVLYMDIVPTEVYVGDCFFVVKNVATGKEVCKFTLNVTTVVDQELRVPFKYPLWIADGQQLGIQVIKEDGLFLTARANTEGTEPWRRVSYRTFTDETVFHGANAALQAQALNLLEGDSRISANAVRDFPVMSGTQLGMAKLGTTMSINGSGELDTAISPTGIKIVANETARLAIPVSGGAILAIQQDNGFTYGIEADEDTSVTGNWKQIGVVATNVVSFKGRNGAVSPEDGDYDQKQIKTIHDNTLVEGWFGIDNTGIYWNDGV